MKPLIRQEVQSIIQQALLEDAASNDVTTRSVLRASTLIQAQVIAKAPGILAGGSLALWVFQTVDPSLRCQLRCTEGASVSNGRIILTLRGRARSIFAAERSALNFLSHLSGIATLTRQYVTQVRAVNRAVQILDTRKTLPGLRALEKYAACVGGAKAHRAKLSDAILIKTNHLLTLQKILRNQPQTIQAAITRAQRRYPHLSVTVEAVDLGDVRAALEAKPGVILLDNMSAKCIRQAVRLRDQKTRRSKPKRRVLLEVSGGVSLENIHSLARTGIDRISIGRLTHSAPALDMSLRVIPATVHH